MIHDVKRDVTAIQVLPPLECGSSPIDPYCSFAEGSGHFVGPCQQCRLRSLSAKHSWLLIMAAKRASSTSHFTGLWSSLRAGALWIKQICQKFKLLTAICCLARCQLVKRPENMHCVHVRVLSVSETDTPTKRMWTAAALPTAGHELTNTQILGLGHQDILKKIQTSKINSGQQVT